MKRLNIKNLIILILMGVASIEVVKDFITLMNGATYTWLGLITALINLSILGFGLDELRG